MGFLVLLSAPLSPGYDILAYLDPGTGSFLVQLLIGGLVGALVFLKAYWNKIRSFFSKRGENQATTSPEINKLETDTNNDQS